MNEIIKDLLLKVKTIGAKEDSATVQAEIEKLIATNANEVMHTTNTGAWKELIQTEVWGDAITNLVPNYSYLLPILPGNHWAWLELKENLPIIWEADLYRGNTEYTTWTTALTASGKKAATWTIAVEQGQFILDIFVSKRELRYSVAQLESILKERMARSMARTVDAFIINADKATSWNVNLNGATPATDSYFLQWDNGLRKLWIANGVDIWTFDEQDILDMIDKLWEFASNPADLVLVVSRKVYNKMLGFTNLKTYDKNRDNATIITWVLANIFWIDVLVDRNIPTLTATDGTVSSTGASNVKGSIVLLYKPAVQYWFGKIDDFEVTTIAWKGIALTSTFEFWFGVVNGEAGLDKTVSVGFNITV